MSHQTGIAASDKLIESLKQAKSGDFRSLKIIINNEKLELDEKTLVVGTFEQDYDHCIDQHIKDDTCCYLLIKSDEKSDTNDYKWILILYTPDKAIVKDKMLYAATKASLKNIFGDGLIVNEIHGTEKLDINYNGFKSHIISVDAAPPLTSSEKQYVEMKKNEVHRSVLEKAETLKGISFPVDKNVIESFEKLIKGVINYIELIVDSNDERIKLGCEKTYTINELSKIQLKDPRYHIFKYNYKHESEDASAIVFIYTMPGYSCAIKDRMMYSSCKGPLIDYFESNYKKIDKKLEEENLSAITEKYIYDELHPPKLGEKETFSRPKRPGRR